MWIEVLLHPGDFNKVFDPRSKKKTNTAHTYTHKKKKPIMLNLFLQSTAFVEASRAPREFNSLFREQH